MIKRHLLVGLLLASLTAAAVRAEKIPRPNPKIPPPSAEWIAKIEQLAPAKTSVEAPKRKALVFSLFTGFDHLVIPHVDEVFKILGKKTGAFDVVVTRDIEALMPDKLAEYDLLVLNNNCSVSPRRNIFLDELERNERYAGLSGEERAAKAKALERSMLDYVAGGKGLVVVHGGIVMLDTSEEFVELTGALFHYHPPSQELTLRTVEPNHPLLAAFQGKGPFVHVDEPYLFHAPEGKLKFRPLLVMDTDTLKDEQGEAGKMVRYAAWIKPHGRGRVFFASPSHFPESYESETMLRFLLDGLQYAAGDLKCDDSCPK
ncbi:MAG: ThuA domain-containing protein [Pirellulaceae bacterium]|nr:ThuA domain-containing protein [Pirellulaceae bacterium]